MVHVRGTVKASVKTVLQFLQAALPHFWTNFNHTNFTHGLYRNRSLSVPWTKELEELLHEKEKKKKNASLCRLTFFFFFFFQQLSALGFSFSCSFFFSSRSFFLSFFRSFFFFYFLYASRRDTTLHRLSPSLSTISLGIQHRRRSFEFSNSAGCPMFVELTSWNDCFDIFSPFFFLVEIDTKIEVIFKAKEHCIF